MKKLNLKAIDRDSLRKTATKFLLIGRTLASITATEKDDLFIELLAGLFEDDLKYQQLCDLLGIPAAPAV